jgi:hypothetical protein
MRERGATGLGEETMAQKKNLSTTLHVMANANILILPDISNRMEAVLESKCDILANLREYHVIDDANHTGDSLCPSTADTDPSFHQDAI